ncbi:MULTISPECIES: Mu transposase domain-containing protein [unclassified Kitasatospora]|uniref:Mu transposase domain-containing protein n=1 Tax=unclassified Kitasatospora TaxID=2633591 RepID=UPI00380E9658
MGQWTNPRTGKRHRVWAFVMVLPCSRHMFVRPVLHMNQHAWTEAHVEAFRFFGGVPRRLVPDNLRTGVDKPDLYHPKINRAYAELATYYGALVDPARALRPKGKPRVERPMPYLRDSFWSGRQFTSVEHMQSEAVTRAKGVAGGRQCRPPGGAAPLSVFEAIEVQALLPLPDTPFVLACWSTATVGPDIHIKVGRTLYSVPWKLIGRCGDVRSTAAMVQIFHDGELVKTHAALEQGKRTDKSDYPPEKIAFQMRTPIWCRTQAAEVGDACGMVIGQLLEVNAIYRLRAAQGVIALRKKYGDSRLEAACAKAMTVGDPSYRTIKGILIADTETDPEPETGNAGAAAFLHGPQQLFASAIPTQTQGELRDDQGRDDSQEAAR